MDPRPTSRSLSPVAVLAALALAIPAFGCCLCLAPLACVPGIAGGGRAFPRRWAPHAAPLLVDVDADGVEDVVRELSVVCSGTTSTTPSP